MSLAYIEGAAGLAMLAAMDRLSLDEPLPPLPTVEKPNKPREKSASLKRMLRKAKR